MKAVSPLETALELLLRCQLWPVAIQPGGKAPIGEAWGLTRPTQRSLEEVFRANPGAGVGLKLGPEAGIIDIEVDGPEGEHSLLKLFDGEIIETIGWSSARGPHRIYRYDPRLSRYKKSVIKSPELPGLEIRIGAEGKQIQSVCPPTAGTDGCPRAWNGFYVIADLPEAAMKFLDASMTRAVSDASYKAKGSLIVPVTSPEREWFRTALKNEAGRVATAPEGTRHDTLRGAARTLAGYLHFGYFDESEIVVALSDAARRAGLEEQDVRDTIDWGITNGKSIPLPLPEKLKRGVETNEPAASTSGEPVPWPPLKLLEAPAAPDFPADVFPAPLHAYCLAAADAVQAPTEFVGSAMLAVAGAAIGQSANLAVKETWIEGPTLYIVQVAPPGKAKSPAIRLVTRPLSQIDRRLRQGSAKVREEWEEKKKIHARSPDTAPAPGPEPPQLRAIVKDVTRESLVTILADNPRGVLDSPDEASAWVASFNEYKGKGGSDRQFWLSVWSSESVTVDRKGGKESRYVPFPFVCVLGGLPPDMLTSLMDDRGRNDGFLDRILFVFPVAFPRQRWTETELDQAIEAEWESVINYLHGTPMKNSREMDEPHRVSFDHDAKLAWVEWYNKHADEMDSDDISDRQAGAWSKMRSYAARCALILSRLREACDKKPSPVPGPILLEDVQGAIRLVDYFKAQMLRIHHQMTGGVCTGDARRIVEWIRRHDVTEFRVAQITEHIRRFREDPRALDSALRLLANLGVIRSKLESVTSGRRGPKPSPRYEVHPSLLTAPEDSDNSANSQPDAPSQGISGIGGNSWRSDQKEPDSYALAEREAIQAEGNVLQ